MWAASPIERQVGAAIAANDCKTHAVLHYGLTDIAVACALGSSSSFSRAFQKHLGVAPSEADLDGLLRQRKTGQDAPVGMHYFLQPFPLESAPDDMRVRVERFGSLQLPPCAPSCRP